MKEMAYGDREGGLHLKCSETGALLELMMDGALREDQLDALEAHAATCADCAAQLRAARTLRDLFDEMPPEVDVPLAAQARWRSAVRQEARARSGRRYLRWASVAAAVVALVGFGSLALRGALPDARSGQIVEAQVEDIAFSDAGGAVVEADGQRPAMASALTAESSAAPMQEVRVTADDVEDARALILDLVSEYEGEADVQPFEGGANLYVTLPGENLEDFMRAIGRWTVEGQPEAGADETASLMLVLSEE